MENEIKTWLYDILNAIQEIDGFFLDRPQKYEDYHHDLRTKRAVERNIEIIGEATNRIYASVLKDYCNACVGFIVSQYLEQASEAGNPSRFDVITQKF
ncbi:MAG: DUF86 domain-containing protein, partial [Tannerella sp.]|nr:DUF86 domain-containing protein [Tannerella sp.]